MTKPRMAVRPMEEADLDAVVQLHVLRFPSSRTTSFGRPFLRRMYHWFWKYHPTLSFVVTADGTIVGFAVGSTNPDYHWQVARHSVIQLARAVLRHPTLLRERGVIRQVANLANQLKEFVSHWRRLFTPAVTAESAPPKIQVELASLATAQSAAGVGLLLVIAFEAAAKRTGADLIAGTVRNENTSLREMYERLGWSHDWNDGSDGAYYRKQFRKAAH